jgi:mitochondrial-processing peptidase subunit alpha
LLCDFWRFYPGLPLVAETRKLDQLSPATVAEFMRDTISPNRIVVAAANIPHDKLVALAEAGLGSLGADASMSDAPALYTGGSIRVSGDGAGHVAIGFNGVSWSDADLIPVCVLHTLLGGGGSFSSGGPGKGMYTRLFSNILNRHGWVSSAVAFNHCYSDSGLFGIHASCADPANLNNLIEVVGSQVGKMSGPLGKDELSRAKAMTKSSLLMNLESRAVVCEDIGRQILGSNKYVGAAKLCAAIDKLDEGDIRRVAAKMLASKPSLVIYGEEYATHAYDAIEGSIKSQIAA